MVIDAHYNDERQFLLIRRQKLGFLEDNIFPLKLLGGFLNYGERVFRAILWFICCCEVELAEKIFKC